MHVVPNNSSYVILKSGMLSLDLALRPSAGSIRAWTWSCWRSTTPGSPCSLSASAPSVLEKPGNLRDVLAARPAGPGPSLVDVAIDRGFKPML